ncbi:MAG: uroporphyrinogen-III synthase [Crocinitomicaceae bacterium]|nr:uroporphyrinogen-III synthase [Crocinitomicaceae bacterium]
MIHTLFISKEIAETSVLRTFCEEHSITILTHSFLSFEPEAIQQEITSEVLFFTSKRAVTYFFKQVPLPANTLIACVGNATAESLHNLGIKVDFSALNSGNPRVVANELTSWLGKKSITFVSAKRSANSILDLLPVSQVEQVCVYETIIKAISIPTTFEVYVFTSPSNLEGFLKLNTIPEAARLIAWGETTATAMREQGLEPTYTLNTSSEKELVSYLLEISL